MVSRVLLSDTVFFAGLCHAFSTEKEEVMGLLLGNWTEEEDGCVAHIWDLCLLQRSDRRKDRVEISPEQLVEANEAAEVVSRRLGKPTHVVGWYHSHPKITVLPSHVDVRTQAEHQQIDSRWLGLIFAVFYRDADQLNRVQVTAFQSKLGNSGWVQTFTPLFLNSMPGAFEGPLNTLLRLPQTLFNEERSTYDASLAAALELTESELQSQLIKLHHGSVYIKSLTNLIDKLCGPILHLIDQRQRHVSATIAMLERQKQHLTENAELLL